MPNEGHTFVLYNLRLYIVFFFLRMLCMCGIIPVIYVYLRAAMAPIIAPKTATAVKGAAFFAISKVSFPPDGTVLVRFNASYE